MIPASVRAFVAEKDGDGVVRQVRSIPSDDLGEGDVVVEVSWSGVNYKDGLATTATGRVARISPLVPGVDLAGTVADPGGSDWRPARRWSCTATTSASPTTAGLPSTPGCRRTGWYRSPRASPSARR